MAQDDVRARVEALILGTRTVRDHLDDFAIRAGHHLGARTHCSVSLRHRGKDRLAAASSPRSAACDEAEYRSGAGPCLTAMDHLQVVLVPDVEADTRWSTWRRATLDQGFRSAAAVPAHVTEGAEIALNLYSEELGAWDRRTLVRADMYAQQVAATVELCLEIAGLTREVTDLRRQRELQGTLDRAVGAVMAARRLTAERALEHLRDRAVADGTDVLAVAGSVLRDIAGPATPAEHGVAGSGDTVGDRA